MEDVARVARAAMEEHHVPGAAMAFIKNGELVLQQCIGTADPVFNVPVTENTYFEAASLTKTVFARLAIALDREGVIDLAKPIAEYTPIHLPTMDERFVNATGQHVLSHATGLYNWGKLPMELAFGPGEGFLYSGTGYYFLQRVIESLLDTRLDGLLQKRIFDPLGMDSASLIWTGAMRKSLARTVDKNGLLEPERNTALHSMGFEPNAAFSLYATIKDYPKFLMWLMKDESAIKLIKSVRNPAAKGIEWGLGWGMDGDTLWHWGDNGGFKSIVRFDPATKDGLLIHTNGANGLEVCYKTAEFVTGDNLAPMANMIAGAE